MNAVRMTSVPALGVRRRRGHERPGAGAGVGVEGVDQAGERGVAVGAELGRVLDLLEADHVGVEAVDGRDDLGLLPLEVVGVGRAPGTVGAAVVDVIGLPWRSV